jgi:O-antigen/teichoic acid export membrane protein
VRGTLSSNGRFTGYARFFGVDGMARVALAAALALVGVATAGPFGVVLALAPFLGAATALVGQRGLLEPGPDAHWAELTRALGWLLAGTVSLALIVQGGTIAVDLLASPDESEAAGVFLNGLVIARIPLFLFQAVLASLLPRLSRLAGGGQLDAFRSALTRLVVAILGVGVVTTIAAALVGPLVVEALFGSASTLGARDLGLLAATFILIMVAICLDQALIALSGHQLMALGWVLSLAVFVVVTALGDDLFLRVELGLLAAAVTASAWMVTWLGVQLRRHPTVLEVSLAEAVAESPLQE